MQAQNIQTGDSTLNGAPRVCAADLPDPTDALIGARLPASELASWRRWLAAPRVRLLGMHGERFRRGLIALTTHTLGDESRPLHSESGLEKIDVLAVSDRGLLLNDNFIEPESILASLTRGPVDMMLDALATHGDDGTLWSVIDKQLRLVESQRQRPPVGDPGLLGCIDPWVEQADAILARAVQQARLTHEEHAAALDAIRCREEALRIQALAWLAEALETDCLAALGDHEGSPTCALYNWLASAPPAHRQRRAQALRSAPFLLDALIHSCEPDAQPLSDLNRIVDQCQPLTPALAAALGLRQSDVRRLRAITHAECVRQDTVEVLRDQFRHLQHLPPEHWPRTHADMDAALTRLYLCDWFAEMIGSRGWHHTAAPTLRSSTPGNSMVPSSVCAETSRPFK